MSKMEPEKLSYLQTPMNIQFRFQTIPDRLKILADQLGEKEVYVFLGQNDQRESITALELYQKSAQLARSFVTLGVSKGDIVGMCLENDLTCLLCYFGVILAGGIVFSFTVTQKDASDVARKLNELKASTFILHCGENHDKFYSCLNFIDDVSPDGAVNSQSVPGLKRFISTSHIPGYHALLLDEIFTFSKYENMDTELPKLDPDDVMIIYSTSGSTGWPKFIPFTHHTVMIAGYQSQELQGYEPDDIIYTERRLVWLGGFPFAYLHNGVKTVTKSVTFPSLEEHCTFTIRAIRTENCTIASLIASTIIEASLSPELKTRPFSLLKEVSTGGQPCTPATAACVGVLSQRLVNYYGATECGVIAADVSAASDFIPFSTGKPLPGVEIKVVGEDGHVVKRGEMGTVHVRSPTVLYQYYNNPVKTKEAISNTHWFNTNDVGYVTQDGRLVVMGREVEQIVQGNAIVHPALVEAIVKTHSAVLDVVVVPVPDGRLFQKVCACVILKPGCTLTMDDIDLLYRNLQYTDGKDPFSYIYPKEVVIFDNFPTLPSDKPDKIRITERAIQQLDVKESW